MFLIGKELKSLKNDSFEAVILGCTHFPLLKEQIENTFNVPSIDMGKCLTDIINWNFSNYFQIIC